MTSLEIVLAAIVIIMAVFTVVSIVAKWVGHRFGKDIDRDGAHGDYGRHDE